MSSSSLPSTASNALLPDCPGSTGEKKRLVFSADVRTERRAMSSVKFVVVKPKPNPMKFKFKPMPMMVIIARAERRAKMLNPDPLGPAGQRRRIHGWWPCLRPH